MTVLVNAKARCIGRKVPTRTWFTTRTKPQKRMIPTEIKK
jgi:hypothetical protein